MQEKTIELVLPREQRALHKDTKGKEQQLYTPSWYMVLWIIFAQSVVWVISRVLLFIFCKYEVHGLEHVASSPKKVIFAANHLGDLDPVLIRASLPLFSKFSPLYTVARKRSDYTWKGWRAIVYNDFLFRTLGAYPAFKGKKNYAASLRLFEGIGVAGYPIAIFIGGQQDTPHSPVEARGGTGYLAYTLKRPVIPISITGTWKMSLRKFLLQRPRIVVRFGAPIGTNELFDTHDEGELFYKNISKKIVLEIERMKNMDQR